MFKIHNPKTIAAPPSNFVHGVEVPAQARTLYISGQTGVRPDGSIPESCEEQADVAWHNMIEILKAAGMSVEDVVKISVFVTDPADNAVAREKRIQYAGEYQGTSTFLVVAGLANPKLKFEIEAVAAKV
ncbi:MAG: RidA family protein [Rhodospirillales bacterium]